MDYDYYGFKPHVSVAARRARAARELAKLQKKGRKISPVVIEGRTIAETFWGGSWCDNLERYSDFANRLPRAGRTSATDRWSICRSDRAASRRSSAARRCTT